MSFKAAIPEGFRSVTPDERQLVAVPKQVLAAAVLETDGDVGAVYIVGLWDALKPPPEMAKNYDLDGITINSRSLEKVNGIECAALAGVDAKGFDVLALLCPSRQQLAQFIFTSHPDQSEDLLPSFRRAVAETEGLTPYQSDGRAEQGKLGNMLLLIAVAGVVGRWAWRKLLR